MYGYIKQRVETSMYYWSCDREERNVRVHSNKLKLIISTGVDKIKKNKFKTGFKTTCRYYGTT